MLRIVTHSKSIRRCLRLAQTRPFSQTQNDFYRTSCGLYIQRGLPKTFNKILIANRGEIACRVIRTGRELGVKCVAIYSDADANAMHVHMADEAYNIGPPPSTESYLMMDRIIETALACGAEAIHPGYGFLSENKDFVAKCEAAGVVFIGPSLSAISAMGSKRDAKVIMEQANVPIVGGYHGADQSAERLKHEGNIIGYPLMIKAVLGGGGKGIRLVRSESEFDDALRSAQTESSAAFGNDEVILEKAVTNARHIEFQVFGDNHGNAVHLFERDCSVQRGNQKLFEESPGPHLSEETRMAMGHDAASAARAVMYSGAGTVEFLLDATTHEYFFMEMNTRLQVEHPVSEYIVKRDLVQWQLHVAKGYELPATQEEVNASRSGHAIEARVNAEDAFNNFAGSTGKIHCLVPPVSPNAGDLRVETGVRENDSVSIHYDSMIAKLIVFGSDRAHSLKKMDTALANFHIGGLTTNIDFLRRILNTDDFQQGGVEISYVKDNADTLIGTKFDVDLASGCYAGLGVILNSRRLQKEVYGKSVWTSESTTGFRCNAEHVSNVKLSLCNSNMEQQDLNVTVQFLRDGQFVLKCDSLEIGVKSATLSTDGRELFIETMEGEKKRIFMCTYGCDTKNTRDTNEFINVWIEGTKYEFSLANVEASTPVYSKTWEGVVSLYDPGASDDASTNVASRGSVDGGIYSPMPGKVVKVLVDDGDAVQEDDVLVILEAMKMQTEIRAPRSGKVSEIGCQPNDYVSNNQFLVAVV